MGLLCPTANQCPGGAWSGRAFLPKRSLTSRLQHLTQPGGSYRLISPHTQQPLGPNGSHLHSTRSLSPPLNSIDLGDPTVSFQPITSFSFVGVCILFSLFVRSLCIGDARFPSHGYLSFDSSVVKRAALENLPNLLPRTCLFTILSFALKCTLISFYAHLVAVSALEANLHAHW